MASITTPLHLTEDDRQAERTLLQHHDKLWGLVSELLVSEVPPSGERAQEIVDGIQVTREEVDAFWAEHQKQAKAEAAKKTIEKEAQRKRNKEELRERYLSDCMEAFADELDALRNDPEFRGTKEDMAGIIGMLEEGLEVIDQDEETQTLYRDYMGKGGGGQEEVTSEAGSMIDGQAQILDEPVHAYFRRKAGFSVATAADDELHQEMMAKSRALAKEGREKKKVNEEKERRKEQEEEEQEVQMMDVDANEKKASSSQQKQKEEKEKAEAVKKGKKKQKKEKEKAT